MENKRQKILVVDDLPDWRATLMGVLVDEGYEVQVADSSASALGLLRSSPFDLALLDMRLDETDESNIEGLDLAGKIKRYWPAIKVVIITGYGTQDTVEQAMASDIQGRRLADEFIPKTQTSELVEVVRRVLAQ